MLNQDINQTYTVTIQNPPFTTRSEFTPMASFLTLFFPEKEEKKHSYSKKKAPDHPILSVITWNPENLPLNSHAKLPKSHETSKVPGVSPGASAPLVPPRDGHHRGDLREAQRVYGAGIRDQQKLQQRHEERPGQESLEIDVFFCVT